MFTSDPNFFSSRIQQQKEEGETNNGSCSHEFRKTGLFNFFKTGTEIETRDPEKTGPGSRGQKSTRSWIRIRNIDPNIPTLPSSYRQLTQSPVLSV